MKAINPFAIASLLVGFALIIAGATWIYRPLGPISAGALLVVAAFVSMRNKS